MSYSTLKLEFNDAIARLTLNRPDRANSITLEMGRELAAAMEMVRASAQARVLVVTGAGKFFCAGADMAEFERMQTAPRAELEQSVRFWLDAIAQMHRLPMPVIARVNGDAFGGGIGLALACDLRVIGVGARLGFVFARVGLSGADAGVTYFLPRIVGPARAMEILLQGKVFGAEEALEAGLVTRAVAAEELDRATDELAAKLAGGPPIATGYTKEGVNESLRRTIDEEFDFESRAQTTCLMTADHQEGVKAFLEKRAPKFEGK